jgi:hypothetical protein
MTAADAVAAADASGEADASAPRAVSPRRRCSLDRATVDCDRPPGALTWATGSTRPGRREGDGAARATTSGPYLVGQLSHLGQWRCRMLAVGCRILGVRCSAPGVGCRWLGRAVHDAATWTDPSAHRHCRQAVGSGVGALGWPPDLPTMQGWASSSSVQPDDERVGATISVDHRSFTEVPEVGERCHDRHGHRRRPDRPPRAADCAIRPAGDATGPVGIAHGSAGLGCRRAPVGAGGPQARAPSAWCCQLRWLWSR